MSHWIILQLDFDINYQARMALISLIYLQPKSKVMRCSKDIKAIEELEPSGIVHIVVFFLIFHKNCINIMVRRRSLTRTSASCTKNAYLQANFKINTIRFHKEISNCFLFLFCFARTSNVHFWDMHLTIIAAHKYLHAKKKTITRKIRNRGKQEMSKPYNCSVHQV